MFGESTFQGVGRSPFSGRSRSLLFFFLLRGALCSAEECDHRQHLGRTGGRLCPSPRDAIRVEVLSAVEATDLTDPSFCFISIQEVTGQFNLERTGHVSFLFVVNLKRPLFGQIERLGLQLSAGLWFGTTCLVWCSARCGFDHPGPGDHATTRVKTPSAGVVRDLFGVLHPFMSSATHQMQQPASFIL